MKKILFVCTGNTCRSPMTHYYMQKRVYDLDIQDDFLINSCGLYASNGQSATNFAQIAIQEYGTDLQNHRAKRIQEIDIENYDVIITLSFTQKLEIIYLFPKLENKVFTLKEYTDNDLESLDITDPWGLDISTYKNCAKEIVENVDKLIEKLKEK